LNDHSLLGYAIRKLICVEPRQGVKLTESAMAAALDVRLCLDYDTTRDATRLADQDMVARHMKLTYSVPDHREYLRSGYSSEPMLAVAAAQVWNKWDQFDSLDVLAAEIKKTGQKVDAAEIVARYLFLKAFDLGVTWTPFAHPYFFPWSGYVSAPTLFKALLSSQAYEELRTKKARNRLGGKYFETAFKDCYVRLSHFAHAGDSSVLTLAGGLLGFARSQGWQCFDQQEHTDIGIPFIRIPNDPNDATGAPLATTLLRQSAVSWILIQVKNRRKVHYVDFRAEDLGLFPPKGVMRPYIVVVLNLGVVLTSAAEATPNKVSLPQMKPALKTGSAKKGQVSNGEHPCWWVNINGCSPKNFNSAIVPDTDRLKKILHSRPFEDVHPRNGAVYMQAVRDMKPTFTGKSFTWARVDDPHQLDDNMSASYEEGIQVLESETDAGPDDDLQAAGDEQAGDADMAFD
jgi:hypothetical protein